MIVHVHKRKKLLEVDLTKSSIKFHRLRKPLSLGQLPSRWNRSRTTIDRLYSLVDYRERRLDRSRLFFSGLLCSKQLTAINSREATNLLSLPLISGRDRGHQRAGYIDIEAIPRGVKSLLVAHVSLLCWRNEGHGNQANGLVISYSWSFRSAWPLSSIKIEWKSRGKPVAGETLIIH